MVAVVLERATRLLEFKLTLPTAIYRKFDNRFRAVATSRASVSISELN